MVAEDKKKKSWKRLDVTIDSKLPDIEDVTREKLNFVKAVEMKERNIEVD